MSIILDHVSHVYGEDTAMAVKALNDVNLVLPDGQFIGLIGHTGLIFLLNLKMLVLSILEQMIM